MYPHHYGSQLVHSPATPGTMPLFSSTPLASAVAGASSGIAVPTPIRPMKRSISDDSSDDELDHKRYVAFTIAWFRPPCCLFCPVWACSPAPDTLGARRASGPHVTDCQSWTFPRYPAHESVSCLSCALAVASPAVSVVSVKSLRPSLPCALCVSGRVAHHLANPPNPPH